SNGGPVLVWGLEAMAVSFLAPHSLHVRPLVVPEGLDLEMRNESPDVPAYLLVDGHASGNLHPGESALVRVDDNASLLATLPEATFFRRYRNVFALWACRVRPLSAVRPRAYHVAGASPAPDREPRPDPGRRPRAGAGPK